MVRLQPIMRNMCPNCGGPISSERLAKGLPCERCLAYEADLTPREVGELLREEGKLLNYAWVYSLEVETEKFKEYFERVTGSSMWSAQESWARRLLLLDSLAIIAPTGVGKTTLLTVYASYRASKNGWRVLYLVPTQNLVKQTAERIASILGPEDVVYYSGSMGKKPREEAMKRLAEGDFRVAVVTTSFLQRRHDVLARNAPYQLVIVDDVDSLLRSGANVERVLQLMGFSEEVISRAEELVKCKLKLYAALAAGKEERARECEERIADIEASLTLELRAPKSQLVIASATGRPRGFKHLLFKELLGFEVGGGSDYMRSVTDAYTITSSIPEKIAEIIKKLGGGGIVFVSQLYGKPYAKLLAEKLARKGVRVATGFAGSRRSVQKLARGEVDVIVGVASRYGVLVRGIDLPQAIKYAIFVEIPARRILLEDALSSPRRLLSLLFYIGEQGVAEAGEHARRIAGLLDRVPDTRIITMAYKGRIAADGVLGELVGEMRKASLLVKDWFDNRLQETGVERIGGSIVEKRNGKLWLVVPDAPTYIQASGRTSRLYRGVMTHGLSIVVSENEDYVKALEERLKWYAEAAFTPLDNLDLSSVTRKIEDSRKGKGKRINVRTVLFIVESPTKAKTIAWFWGRPSRRRLGRLSIYETSTVDPETGTVYLLSITATKGHMLDLAIDEPDSIHGVRVENGIYKPVYTSVKRCLKCGYVYSGEGACPRCGSTAVYNAQSSIETLRKLAMEVDMVIVASDPDREGEKIAWDVYLALKPYNRNIWRGRFHEVTRNAILEALRHPDQIDERLVKSQIVRRVEDRWIGFTLSRHLWAVFGERWLGAGRVQTPVLGWAIDRYRQWESGKGYILVYSVKETGEKIRVYVKSREEADKLKNAGVLETVEAEVFSETVAPPPPYTTDALLYDANRRLKYSASFTMKLAQDLFESGLITYHRTDSTRVSKTGMGIAKTYLEKRGLEDHYYPRQWGEGGAHEAIRPTRPLDAEELRKLVYEGTIRVPIKLTGAHFKLYDMIFRRFIASQMSPSTPVKARVKARIGSVEVEYTGVISPGKEGFHLVDPPRTLSWLELAARRGSIPIVFEKKVRGSTVRLYTTGDLVRLMREKGIGRPSTYAKAIEANRRHGYIVLSKKLNYVIPTKRGVKVYNYLAERFHHLVSEETSRRLEEVLDGIEEGRIDPAEALDSIGSMIGRLVPGSLLSNAGIVEGEA